MTVRILVFIAVSCLIYLLIALGLILSQSPGPPQAGAGGLDFAGVMARDNRELPGLRRGRTTMTDGTELPVTFAGEGDATRPLIVMVHGSGWIGAQFDGLAAALADRAEIRAVTLRGHGAGADPRGDIAYIGQLEDDLASVIGDQPPARKVVLLGHSSGGGLVVRFAGGAHRGLIDGAVLLAPFLKYNAPVTRTDAGGWADPLTRRIIGLSMLNAVGIHALDHLTVIRFAMPQAVLDGPMGAEATTRYSWRLNRSFAPRADYLADVAALPEFLLVAGAGDEAFDAAGYAPLMSGATDRGRYEVLPGVGHLDVVDAPATARLIREFLHEP